MKKYLSILICFVVLFLVTGCGKNNQVTCSKSEVSNGVTASVSIVADLDNDDRIKEASVVYDLGDKTKADALCEALKKTYDKSKIECSGNKITVKGMDDFTDDVEDSVKMVGRTKEEFTKEAVSAGYTCK